MIYHDTSNISSFLRDMRLGSSNGPRLWLSAPLWVFFKVQPKNPSKTIGYPRMSKIWKDHLDDLRVPHGTPHCRNRHSSWCSHGRGRWWPVWPVWPVWCRTGASQGQQDQMGIHELFINKSHKRLSRFLGFKKWWSILHHEWDVSFFGMPGCLYQYIGVSKHIFRLCLDMALSGFDFSDERVYVGGWWMVVGTWKWLRFECLTSKRRLIKDTVTTLDRGICQTPAFDLNADGLLPFHPFHPPLDLTGHLRFRWSCLCRSQRLRDGLRIRHHQRVDMTFQAFQGTIAELQLLPGLTPWLCWNLERLTKCHVLLCARSLLQVNRFWTCLPVSYQISNMWSNAKLLVFELSLNRSALGWFQGREAFFARMKWVIDLVRGMDLSNQTGFGCCLYWPHCLWSMWTPLDLQSGGMFTVHTFADADTWIMCALIILPYAGGCTHTHIGT